MTLALDISHFTKDQSGNLTNRQLTDAWNAGVRMFRPSIANQQIAVEQIDAIVDYGEQTGNKFLICTYRYYYFNNMLETIEEDKGFIQRVRDLKYNIQLHSIDVEDTNQNYTSQQRIEIVRLAIPKFENFCVTDLYTAEWYWEAYMANTSEFNYMPLWYAWWPLDKQPRLNIPVDRQFGGWTKAVMHQYIGETYFSGIWCDINYYENTQLEPTPPPVINQGVYTNVEYDAQGKARKITLDIVG